MSMAVARRPGTDDAAGAPMRFSLFYNFDGTPEKNIPELYRDVEEQALVAERLGFDAIWLAEHHFTDYGRLPSPLQYLTWIAARTSTIDLGTAVVEAPYYNPLRLAEDAALLDVLSDGRVRLGIGSGARSKTDEFARFGLPIQEKSARTLEVIEVVQQGLADPSIQFDGQYYRYRNVEINPRPVQAARDLIWVAASQTTVELAAARGYGLLIPRVGNGETHHELTRRYREAPHGQPGFVSQLRFVYVAQTEHEAKEQTRLTFA